MDRDELWRARRLLRDELLLLRLDLRRFDDELETDLLLDELTGEFAFLRGKKAGNFLS